MHRHRHQKYSQFGVDGGNAFADGNVWSRVGGSAGGGAGYTDYEGEGGSQNLQPYQVMQYVIKF